MLYKVIGFDPRRPVVECPPITPRQGNKPVMYKVCILTYQHLADYILFCKVQMAFIGPI